MKSPSLSSTNFWSELTAQLKRCVSGNGAQEKLLEFCRKNRHEALPVLLSAIRFSDDSSGRFSWGERLAATEVFSVYREEEGLAEIIAASLTRRHVRSQPQFLEALSRLGSGPERPGYDSQRCMILALGALLAVETVADIAFMPVVGKWSDPPKKGETMRSRFFEYIDMAKHGFIFGEPFDEYHFDKLSLYSRRALLRIRANRLQYTEREREDLEIFSGTFIACCLMSPLPGVQQSLRAELKRELECQPSKEELIRFINLAESALSLELKLKNYSRKSPYYWPEIDFE